ncbi:MAG: NUDIX domain-containing protein [Candidatus Pacebacteria bacterium]|nr:NUDIX domain-containing protein [Candidatus Paceibacterota bacterium]
MERTNVQNGIDCIGVTIGFLCHDGHGNILLSKRGMNCRDEQGRWDSGGGALEQYDTVEETLHKEIREEYGTEVISFEFLGYRDVHREYAEKRTHWIALDFKVLVNRSMVYNAEPHKFDAVDWFTLDTFPSPLHSQFPFFLKKYHDKLK